MAGSNNFLQFNPTQANQESDGAYAADATRSGGIVFNQIMSSLLGNKLFYQVTTFVAALAAALAAKGYNMLDSNFANLVTALGNLLTKADLRNYKNGVPSTSYVQSLTGIPAGIISAGNILRFKATTRCTGSPSGGADNFGLLLSGPQLTILSILVQTGDFVTIEADILITAVGATYSGTAYYQAYGVSAGNPFNFYFENPVTGMTLASAPSFSTSIFGTGTGGTFSSDYITLSIL